MIFKACVSQSRFLILALFYVLLITVTPGVSHAMNLAKNVASINESTYEHWHIKNKKVTGYTITRYETKKIYTTEYVVETSRNLTSDHEIFSEKKSWFLSKTGELAKSTETDFRTNTTITHQLTGGQIITNLKNESEIKRLKTPIEPRLILSETLALGIQVLVPEIMNQKKIGFILYVPVLAFDLEEYHLPQSLSKVTMTAKLEKIEKKKTKFGTRKTAVILIQPDSFFLRNILPKSKTEFRFTYLATAPFHLLSLQNANSVIRLVDVQFK